MSDPTGNTAPAETAEQRLSRLEREHQVMRETLTEISEGKGRYSLDQYEHACNTIEDMKELALSALSQIGAEKKTEEQ